MTAAKVEITMPVSRPDPLFKPEGDPAGIDALAAIVLEAAGRFDEYSDESAQFHRRQGWIGQSSEEYVGRSKAVAVRAGRMRNTLKRTGRVLLACADRLRNHQRAYEQHVERKATLDHHVAALAGEINGAGTVTDEQLEAFRMRARELDGKYEALVEDDRVLRDRATSDEELLVDTLDSATSRDDVTATDGGRPEIAQRAMQKKGAPGEDSSPSEVRQWWKGLSDDEKRAVVASYAHAIAGADGLPPEVRERADRIRDEEVTTRLQSKTADGTVQQDEAERLARIEKEAAREARDTKADREKAGSKG